jgi:PsbP
MRVISSTMQLHMLLVFRLVMVSTAWLVPGHGLLKHAAQRDSMRTERLTTMRILSMGESSDNQSNPSPATTTSAVSNAGDDASALENNVNRNEKTTPTSESSSSNPPVAMSRPNGPTTEDFMLAMGTNPRRIFLGTLSATGIALAGNFLGVTSRLLTAVPEDQVEAIGIDTYFPRGDYKRCRTIEYTFVIPKEWVADTFVELAKAQRRIQPLDYSMQRRNGNGGFATLPDSAYGPAGRLNERGVSETGDTNVSVIVSSGLSGFTLQGTLGTPNSAAEKLLSLSIAPEGSGRTATLLGAVKEGSKYKFEYLIDRGERGPPLRNIAVIAASPSGDKLYTLTVVAPAEKWKKSKYETQFRKIADSFHLR